MREATVRLQIMMNKKTVDWYVVKIALNPTRFQPKKKPGADRLTRRDGWDSWVISRPPVKRGLRRTTAHEKGEGWHV